MNGNFPLTRRAGEYAETQNIRADLSNTYGAATAIMQQHDALTPSPLREREEFLNERSEFRNSGEGGLKNLT